MGGLTEVLSTDLVDRFVAWAVAEGRLSVFEDEGGFCAEVVEVNEPVSSLPPECPPGYYLVWGNGRAETIEKHPSWQAAIDRLNQLGGSLSPPSGTSAAEATWSRY
jgi:hypothetical protein